MPPISGIASAKRPYVDLIQAAPRASVVPIEAGSRMEARTLIVGFGWPPVGLKNEIMPGAAVQGWKQNSGPRNSSAESHEGGRKKIEGECLPLWRGPPVNQYHGSAVLRQLR